MAYDELLAQRILGVLGDRERISERRMFGGWALMLGEHMACGVIGDELLARVGKEGYEDALDLPHVRQMDFTGRPMSGFVIVERPGIDDDAELRAWVERCAAFVATLPPKRAAFRRS